MPVCMFALTALGAALRQRQRRRQRAAADFVYTMQIHTQLQAASGWGGGGRVGGSTQEHMMSETAAS